MSLFNTIAGDYAGNTTPRPKGRGLNFWTVVAALGLLAVVVAMPGLSKLPATEQGAAMTEGEGGVWASREMIAYIEAPYFSRSAEEERLASISSARTLAQQALAYATALEGCGVKEVQSSDTSLTLKLDSQRLIAIRTFDRRHAARLRVIANGEEVETEQVTFNGLAVEVAVDGFGGVKGDVMITTDPDGSLPDCDALPLGGLVAYVR